MDDLIARLEKMRKELCHGPCGQSSSVLKTRAERDQLLKETISELKKIAEKEKQEAAYRELVEQSQRMGMYGETDTQVEIARGILDERSELFSRLAQDNGGDPQ